MRNDGTHIQSERETFCGRLSGILYKVKGALYTWWNKRKFGTVGKQFYAPERIHVVNGRNIYLGDHVFLGKNCQLYAYANGKITIGNNTSIDRYVELRGGRKIQIGDNVRVVKGATIKGAPDSDIVIGDRTLISQDCILDGNIIIGQDVIFGPKVFVNEVDHGFARRDIPMNQQSGAGGVIIIEDDVWLGYSSVLLKGVRVEKGSIIGAGAIVNKSCPPYSINVGVPSATKRFRDE